MKHNGRIMVPLDGSEVAEEVLPQVETFARAFDASIVILRAYYSHAPSGIDSVSAQLAEKKAKDYLTDIKKQLKTKGFDVSTTIAFSDDAARAILDHCRNIDLIMMSTHGRSGVGHWLLGSVAEKVVHHATVPVLLVRAVPL